MSIRPIISLSSTEFEQITIRGLPYDRGLSYGQQAKHKIWRAIDHHQNFRALPPWAECLQFAQKDYLPAISKYYPRGLKEMQGIADGAGVTLLDVIALNARYDLSRVGAMRRVTASLQKSREEQGQGQRSSRLQKGWQENCPQQNDVDQQEEYWEVGSNENECTGAVTLGSATECGDVLLGQNLDQNYKILEKDLLVILRVFPDPSENIQPLVMLTEAGQLGRCGMNSNGLGIIGMSLFCTNEISDRDPTLHPHGWLPVTLLRRMFLESPNFSVGLYALLNTPRHVASSLIVATKEGEALALEIVPDHYFVINPPLDQEILTHSNHFKSETFLSRPDMGEGSRGGSTLFRDRRVAKVLYSQWPKITEQCFHRAFRDHVGYPDSVCKHAVAPEERSTSLLPWDVTVASVVFNLTNGYFQLSKGPPCSSNYKTYTL